MKKSGVNYKGEYHEFIIKRDIPKLDKAVRSRIKAVIEIKIMTAPEIFGAPLRGTLKGYWKLRVGDWRIVYLISSKVVKIIFIAHRREVYNLVERRIG